MPPRVALREIDANRTKGHDLSPGTRGKIISRHAAGQSMREIGRAMEILQSTINTTIQRNATMPKRRPGQPRKATPQEVDHIITTVQRNPKITWKELAIQANTSMSHNALVWILHKHNLLNWRSRKRPSLNEAQAEARLAFVLQNLSIAWQN